MRIESVRLRAFGPFRDREIEYAPGLTVVVGPNESGKSTIHAATYSALCGMRRGKGAARVEDREFAELHRPWQGKEWLVTGVVRLEDGRRIELRHDLDGKVDARATDLVLGRDVSDEIVFEGAPDGSRWLGLDRRSFRSTACVSQAQILVVRDVAHALQEHLQRAAATAGADETAALGLALIREYARENVGLDRINAKRPLRAAIDRENAARTALALAREAHERYDHLAARMDALDENARQAQFVAAAAEGALAARDARVANERLRDAERLASALAACEPDPEWLSNAELARQVAEALASWSTLGSEPVLNGPTPDQLRKEISGLPDAVAGDVRLDKEIMRWRDAYVAADGMLVLAVESEPTGGTPVTAPLSVAQLRTLADALETEIPSVPDELSRRHEAAERALNGSRRSGARLSQLVGLVGGLIALALLNTGWVREAVAAVLVGGGAALFLHWRRQRGLTRARLELMQVEGRIEPWLARARQVVIGREAAHGIAADAGLPPTPSEIRALADMLVDDEARVRATSAWRERVMLLRHQREAAGRSLSAALQTRGVQMGDDLVRTVAEYAAACAARAEIEHARSRQEGLERQLGTQEQAAATVAEWHQRRSDIVGGLRALAANCGLVSEDAATTARQLRDWQSYRAQLVAAREARLRDEAQLAALLSDGNLDELRRRVERSQARADELCRGIDEREIRQHDHISAEDLDRLRVASRESADQASVGSGQLTQLRTSLPPVAEAEEALAVAQAELRRVRVLEATLEKTAEFLESAQARVHRDIAPVLARTVTEWLPRVTAGRYTEAIVDPETLNVRVRPVDGEWRDAARLSQGTFELVYLLLRIALARHLVRSGECAPLLFDDVTVQCDTERTDALMALLHQVSTQQQIIVFSQEQDVREWAERNVRLPQDRLEILDGAAVS